MQRIEMPQPPRSSKRLWLPAPSGFGVRHRPPPFETSKSFAYGIMPRTIWQVGIAARMKCLRNSDQKTAAYADQRTGFRPFGLPDTLALISSLGGLHMFRNMPLPHSSKVSHRHFVISFFSNARTAFIPSNRSSSSASFLWESVRQRSEARVDSRKPKNKCRISVNVKPSWRAR